MASGANNNPELGATGSSDPHNSNNRSPTRDLGDEHQFTKRKRTCKLNKPIDMGKTLLDDGRWSLIQDGALFNPLVLL
ncbi:hypothetical protein Tco_1099103 [Tanacetum coccineum]